MAVILQMTILNLSSFLKIVVFFIQNSPNFALSRLINDKPSFRTCNGVSPGAKPLHESHDGLLFLSHSA